MTAVSSGGANGGRTVGDQRGGGSVRVDRRHRPKRARRNEIDATARRASRGDETARGSRSSQKRDSVVATATATRRGAAAVRRRASRPHQRLRAGAADAVASAGDECDPLQFDRS